LHTTIGTQNIVSINTQAPLLTELPATINVLTETQNFGKPAIPSTLNGFFGPPTKNAGVGVVYQKGLKVEERKTKTPNGNFFYNSGRLILFVFQTKTGPVFTAGVYGFAKGTKYSAREAKRGNGKLIEAAVGELKLLAGAGGMYCLTGDLNTNHHESQILKELLLSGELHDPHEKLNRNPQPTYQNSTRIDYVLVNTPLFRITKSARVFPAPPEPTIFPDHRSPYINLYCPIYTEHTAKRKKPKPFDLHKLDAATPGEIRGAMQRAANHIAKKGAPSHHTVLNNALKRNNTTKALLTWCNILEYFMAEFSTNPEKGSYGRGRVFKPTIAPPPNIRGGKETLECGFHKERELHREVRRVDQFKICQNAVQKACLKKKIQNSFLLRKIEILNDVDQNDLNNLETAIRNEITKELNERNSKRLNNWRERMVESANSNYSDISNWMAEKAASSFMFVMSKKGVLTAKLSEVDDAITKAWFSIFRRDDRRPKTNRLSAFQTKYDKHLKKHKCDIQKISGRDLKKYCQKFANPKSASGPDEIEMRILKTLGDKEGTDAIFEYLADILNAIEGGAPWPSQMIDAYMVLVPKDGSNGDPLTFRPITVLSTVYRVWAGFRFRSIREWHTKWERGSTFQGTEEVYWNALLEFEVAGISGRDAFLSTFDFQKCYDSISWPILFHCLEKRGLDPKILGPMTRFYQNLSRINKFSDGAVGNRWKPSNGMIQGCVLSIMALNAIVSIWEDEIREQVGEEILAGIYADDLSIITHDLDVLVKVETITKEFAELADMILHPNKCYSTANSPNAFQKLRNKIGKVTTPKEVVALLGTDVGLPNSGKPKYDARKEKTIKRLKRAKIAPVWNAASCGSSCLPHGTAGFEQEDSEKITIRAKALHALGFSDSNRCAEIIFTVLYNGFLLDPFQYMDLRALKIYYKMLRKAHPHITAKWCAALMQDTSPSCVRGPLTRTQKILKSIGWSMINENIWKDEAGRMFNLRDLNKKQEGEFWHCIREAIRKRELQKAINRRNKGQPARKDLGGAEHGINKNTSMRLHDKSYLFGTLSAYELGILRHILAGAMWTHDRLARRGPVSLRGRPNCPYCGTGQTETHQHMWYECEKHKALRADVEIYLLHVGVSYWDLIAAMPSVLATCGLLPTYPPNILNHNQWQEFLPLLQKMMIDITLHRMELDRAQDQGGDEPPGAPDAVYTPEYPEEIDARDLQRKANPTQTSTNGGHEFKEVEMPENKRNREKWKSARQAGLRLIGYECVKCGNKALAKSDISRYKCSGTTRDQKITAAKRARHAEETLKGFANKRKHGDHALFWNGNAKCPIKCLQCTQFKKAPNTFKMNFWWSKDRGKWNWPRCSGSELSEIEMRNRKSEYENEFGKIGKTADPIRNPSNPKAGPKRKYSQMEAAQRKSHRDIVKAQLQTMLNR